MEKVTLFYLENPDIKISMQLYFNKKGQLCFDGYDTGKSVQKIWGSSSYEYCYIVDSEEVTKFNSFFNIIDGNKSDLLQAIQREFSVNKAYSLFGEFMLAHNIKRERFTWN